VKALLKPVRFKPTKLLDPVKAGGTMQLGKTFEGEMLVRKDGGKIVYFEDTNKQGWVFWAGVTCELISEIIK